METVYEDNKHCCGCKSCLRICPTASIVMVEDQYGFEYPSIDQNTCINCGRCKSVCPMVNVSGKPVESSYAVVLDDKAIDNSASGGAFYALAKAFLEMGGVVFGCAFDESLMPKHIQINDASELYKLQGSKYVQSDMDCHEEILGCLKSGKKVLFSGTPCQVAAIKSFVPVKFDELFTIEIVCHGVPNRALWKDYVDLLEKKHNGKVKKFIFRAKDAKKRFCYKYSVLKKDKETEYIFPSVLSYYYYHFLKGNTYRRSCYYCPFAQPSRQADITICDYWGYQGSRFKDRNDISAVMIQGEKGIKLFELGREYLLVEETVFDDVAENNEQLKTPSSFSRYDEEFFKTWKSKGSLGLEKKHKSEHWKAYMLHKLGMLK